MIYKFIDRQGTFIVKNPHPATQYFPLTNKEGTLLSSISPNLAGDIKKDNEHFLTPPASFEDLRSNLLCRREFFIKVKAALTSKTLQNKSKGRVNNETLRLSYADNDKIEAGLLYHKIIKNTKFLEVEVLNFIPADFDVEVMWVKVKNKTKGKLKITSTSFIPLYGRSEKNLRDHRHVTSLLNRIYLTKFGILLKPTMIFDEKGHCKNPTIYFVFAYEGKKQAPAGQFPTLDYFYGKGDLVHPEAIEGEVPALTKNLVQFEGKEACAAFRFRERTLRGSEEIDYFLIMGLSENEEKIKSTFKKLDSLQKIKFQLKKTKKYWFNCSRSLEFDFANKDFNNWLLWVKYQPTLRKLFGCSFLPHFDYGKGGHGWRDLWQDILTLLLSEPKPLKKQIENNFKGIRIDGSNATIITKGGKFISDRNQISRVWMDHGLWPYLVLKLYINKTSAINILLRQTQYFQDHNIKRARQIDLLNYPDDLQLRTKNKKIYKGSILEHLLIQNLVAFFNVGSHNIIRLENADWNDALDMAQDKGESVTFSFMYAYNLRDICSFLEEFKKRKKTIYLLGELMLLLDRINHPINPAPRPRPKEWDFIPPLLEGAGFTRGGVNYNDFRQKQRRLNLYLEKTLRISGKRVKVNIDDLIADLKEKSTHQFNWLRKKEWLNLGFFNGYYDNKERRFGGKHKKGIQMMLAPQVFAIMSGAANKEQIKRIWASIKKYLRDKRLKGFRLNTNFGSLHLDLGRAFGFSYGDKENGAFFSHMTVMLANALYRQNFKKEGVAVLDSLYKMATSAQAKIYPGIPEYFNNQGRGQYFYLTGSASWYIYTLFEEVFGIKFILGDILIAPKLISDNFFRSNIEAKFNHQGKRIKVVFAKKKKAVTFLKINELFLERTKILPQDGKYIIRKRQIKSIPKKEVTIKVNLA